MQTKDQNSRSHFCVSSGKIYGTVKLPASLTLREHLHSTQSITHTTNTSITTPQEKTLRERMVRLLHEIKRGNTTDATIVEFVEVGGPARDEALGIVSTHRDFPKCMPSPEVHGRGRIWLCLAGTLILGLVGGFLIELRNLCLASALASCDDEMMADVLNSGRRNRE